jgi:hypothetical protein
VAAALAVRMTERKVRFDYDDLTADAEPAETPVTTELHGGFAAPLPRGCELANVTAELPAWCSPERTRIAPPENVRLELAFEHLERELARLAPRWTASAPVARITAMVHDFASFMRVMLEDVELEPMWSRAGETQLLVHDTYVRLICVAGVLREGMDDAWAPAADLASAYAHACAVLDAFAPFVGLADRAMRRICLEGETLEGSLRWLSGELDDEAR